FFFFCFFVFFLGFGVWFFFVVWGLLFSVCSDFWLCIYGCFGGFGVVVCVVVGFVLASAFIAMLRYEFGR
ncbi:hypothetical protein ABVB83_18400, partial [Vibrio cholerae]